MTKTRKEIQQERMFKYFIDATVKHIEEKGLQNITVREIADKAGYTSSTVYNYFDDLSHLKFFAVMRYTRSYIQELPLYMERGENTIDKWLYAWECFCKHSFKIPEIYSLLFVENLGKVPYEIMDQYYRIFSSDLIDLSKDIRSIITQHSISKRSAMYIQEAIAEEFLAEEEIAYISDTTMLIWTGMLTDMLNLRRDITSEEATEKTMNYIYKTIMMTIEPSKRSEITYELQTKE